MGDLCFTLLGPPEVRHADQTLLFSTRKELALLIYLAVEGRIHLRKNLSEQFWPDSDARHGRARHWLPVRSRYKMALITSRMSVVRGCPPGLAGGMSGERMAHSFSVRSTSVAESFHCSTSSIFPLVLLLYYITFHTASNTTVTLKSQAEERKSSSEACKTCSMRVQRP